MKNYAAGAVLVLVAGVVLWVTGVIPGVFNAAVARGTSEAIERELQVTLEGEGYQVQSVRYNGSANRFEAKAQTPAGVSVLIASATTDSTTVPTQWTIVTPSTGQSSPSGAQADDRLGTKG